MRIHSITYPAAYKCTSFAASNHVKQNNKPKQPQANKKPRVIQDSLSTVLSWFGFGVVLDLISRKITFSKSPLKNSVALNGVIGLSAGLITCGKDIYVNRKNNKIETKVSSY